MAKAKRLSVDQLENIRMHMLEHGGVLFKRMCPRQTCHSVVVLHKDAVVCLTCGWRKGTDQWGPERLSFTPEQAVPGSNVSYRALGTLVDPNRWNKLLRKARKRDDQSMVRLLETVTRELARLGGAQEQLATEQSEPAQSQDSFPEVFIYTDGACDPNPGPGGWAAILWSQESEMEIAGGEPNTTNNRMELTAALQGLWALKTQSRVTIVTDSGYLFNSMTNWITRWSRQGWRRTGQLIPNTDLWKELARASLQHETYWSWTRGHAGQPENERCDQLASSMIGRVAPNQSRAVVHRQRRKRKGSLPKVRRQATVRIFADRLAS